MAEGAPLLREYRVKSLIEGSNPSLSARYAKRPHVGRFAYLAYRRWRMAPDGHSERSVPRPPGRGLCRSLLRHRAFAVDRKVMDHFVWTAAGCRLQSSTWRRPPDPRPSHLDGGFAARMVADTSIPGEFGASIVSPVVLTWCCLGAGVRCIFGPTKAALVMPDVEGGFRCASSRPLRATDVAATSWKPAA